MNFRNPKILGLAFYRLRLLVSGGLSPKKAPFRSVGFLSVVSVCSKTFSCRLWTGYRKTAVFRSGSDHVRIFRNVLREQSPLPDINGFSVYSAEFCCIELDFWYSLGIIKRKSSSFGLEPPMHRSWWNWTRRCIQYNNRVLSNIIHIGRHLGEWRAKNLFWHIVEGWAWTNDKLNCLFIYLFIYLFESHKAAETHNKTRQKDKTENYINTCKLNTGQLFLFLFYFKLFICLLTYLIYYNISRAFRSLILGSSFLEFEYLIQYWPLWRLQWLVDRRPTIGSDVAE